MAFVCQDRTITRVSVVMQVQATSILTIPTVPYKPTADCAYSQLVNRIQGSQVDGAGGPSLQNKNEAEENPQAHNQLSYEQQQYYQYYYTVQYYEYYKQLVQQFHSMGGEPVVFNLL